jgi:serine protease Do
MIRSRMFRLSATRLAALALAGALAAPVAQAQSRAPATDADAQALLGAVVRVKARALANARSNATLGRDREGTGVLIDDAGHILTIGYLVIEPDAIEVTTASGKTVAATLAGYDHASGFGLLRAQAPLGERPMALGDSARVAPQEPVMILPAGGRETASVARVMSTRPFTGSWEYLLDSAIFTSPPTMTWAGAALVNRDLRLVGIGSLLVRDSAGGGTPSPGNMFVPIDLLKPILQDLVAQGKRAGPARPWLGLATEEVQGRLLVTRVSPDSPADRAGLKQGDIVVAVAGDSVRTHAELYKRIWGLGAAGVEVPLRVLQGADMRELKVRSIDREAYFEQKAGT